MMFLPISQSAVDVVDSGCRLYNGVMTSAGQEKDLLEDRSYRTYRARLKASQRLQTRAMVWNAVLIGMSVATSVAGIGLLTNSSLFGEHGQVLLCSTSVLTLATSLVVTSRDYTGRARDMTANYRKIQRLSADLERNRSTSDVFKIDVDRLYRRYNDLLDESENHTSADYYLACLPAKEKAYTGATTAQFLVTYIPALLLIVPIAFVGRTITWALG